MYGTGKKKHFWEVCKLHCEVALIGIVKWHSAHEGGLECIMRGMAHGSTGRGKKTRVIFDSRFFHNLTRIIHQPEKSTREGPFGGQMILNTTVCQGHHDLKASSSDGLGSVQIGLSVAIRRTSSWQPPRADNHRFALEPPNVSIVLIGPATSDVHTLTTLNSASIPAPPGTTRAMQS